MTSTIIRQIAAAIILLALTVTLALAAVAAGAGPASASPAGHGRYWWDVETCHDFTLYEHGRRPFAQLYRASQHADTYLKADVGLWASDWQHHASIETLGLDRGYVALDCTTTADGE
jgi:hypothetical protein